MKKILLVFLLIIVATFLILHYKKKEPYIESYDTNKLLSSDINGNINLTDNIQGSLKSITDTHTSQISQLNDKVSQLTNQLNNIINGSTPLNNLTVNETLTINTSSQVPLKIKKNNDDKTGLFEWLNKNGSRYKIFGIDSNANIWNGNGWGP